MLRSSPTRGLLSGVVAALLVWLTSLDCATCLITEKLDAGGCEVMAVGHRPACCAQDSPVDAAPAEPSAVAALGLAPDPDHAPECPMLATSYGDSETPRFDSASDLVTAATDAAPLVFTDPRVSAPARRPERLANRGDTYLRCRVLLI